MANVNGNNTALMNKAQAAAGNNNPSTTSKKPQNIFEMLVASGPEIAKALPKHLTPERMSRIALTTLRKTPKLALCTPQSFIAAVLTGAQLGLEVNTPLGLAHIVPYERKFKDDNGTWHTVLEAEFQLGYPGVIELAMRTGLYECVRVKEVYAKDEFYYEYGLNADIKHKRSTEEEPGEVVYIYALYKLKNGGNDFEVWPINQVIRHAKKYSKSYKKDKKTGEGYFDEKSAWATNLISMGKKTLIKAVLKYAPKSVEFMQQLDSDEKIKTEISANMLEVPAIEYSRPVAELEDKTEEPQTDETEKQPDSGAEKTAEDPNEWTNERIEALLAKSHPLKTIIMVKRLAPADFTPIIIKHDGDLRKIVDEIDGMKQKPAPENKPKAAAAAQTETTETTGEKAPF